MKIIGAVAGVIILFTLVVLFAISPKVETLNLPHSGEQVALIGKDSGLFTLMTSCDSHEIAENLDKWDRDIEYEKEGGNCYMGEGGEKSILKYSDRSVTYQIKKISSSARHGGGNYEKTVYQCLKGECGFSFFVNETSINPLHNFENYTACFSNATYQNKYVSFFGDNNITTTSGEGCPISSDI